MRSVIPVSLLAVVAAWVLFVGMAKSQEPDNRMHLIFVGDNNAPQLAWFAANPDMAALKNATRFSHYKTTDAIFRERFAPVLGTNAPMIILERPDGGTIYAADKNSLPRFSSACFLEMKAAYQKSKEAKKPEPPPFLQQFAVDIL